MKMKPPTLLGATLRRLRGERTLQQIEALTGNRVNVSTISRLETGDHKSANPEALTILAEALGVVPETFKSLAAPIPAAPDAEFMNAFVNSLPKESQARLQLRLGIFESNIEHLKRQLEAVTEPYKRLAVLSQLASLLEQQAEHLESAGHSAAETRKESDAYLQQALQEAKKPLSNESATAEKPTDLRTILLQIKRLAKDAQAPPEQVAVANQLADLLGRYLRLLEEAGADAARTRAENARFLEVLQQAERSYHKVESNVAGQTADRQRLIAVLQQQLKGIDPRDVGSERARLAVLSQLASLLEQQAEHLESAGHSAAETRKESDAYLQQALQEARSIRAKPESVADYRPKEL